jgi:hypothetical protein
MCKFVSTQNPRNRLTDNVFQTASSPSPPSALLSRSPEWPMPASSKSPCSSGAQFSSACTLSSSASSESRTVATPSGSLLSERLEPEESSRTKSNCTIYSRRLAGRIYLARGVDRYNSKVSNRVDHFADVRFLACGCTLRITVSFGMHPWVDKSTARKHCIGFIPRCVIPESQMISGNVILKSGLFCIFDRPRFRSSLSFPPMSKLCICANTCPTKRKRRPRIKTPSILPRIHVQRPFLIGDRI